MAIKIAGNIRDELYLDLRFLEIPLSALSFAVINGLHTTATDGRNLYFSSEQMLRVFRSNAQFLNRAYLHTVLHCLFFHLWTRMEKDERIWNLACDVAVEYTIDHMKLSSIKQIKSWIRQQLYSSLEAQKKGISAAVIYHLISSEKEDRLGHIASEFYIDDHRFWPKMENPGMQNPDHSNWNKIARQSKISEERKGQEDESGAASFLSQVKIEKSRRSYRDFLQKFSVLREEMKSDPDEYDMNYYTYGLRLYHNMPLIEPVESRESKKIQEFVIVIDTSYSTNGTLVKNFLKETFRILTLENSFFHKSHIRILQCDEKVQMDESVHTKGQLQALIDKFAIIGGGGTDFRPAFSYVDELISNGVLKDLCGLLYFTDGKGTYPRKKPNYKTAFLFLDTYEETQVPAWAIQLKLEPDEFYGKGEIDEHSTGKAGD
ncbi:MAG: VWA-like domain-containing protein [Lachnospiraceae bacterium]